MKLRGGVFTLSAYEHLLFYERLLGSPLGLKLVISSDVSAEVVAARVLVHGISKPQRSMFTARDGHSLKKLSHAEATENLHDGAAVQ